MTQESGGSGFKFCHLLAVWFGANCLPSLFLSRFIYKMKIRTMHTSRDCHKEPKG